jgi:hypothetical protein
VPTNVRLGQKMLATTKRPSLPFKSFNYTESYITSGIGFK